MKFNAGYTLALSALAGTACAQISNVGVAVAPPQLQRVLSQPAPQEAVISAPLTTTDGETIEFRAASPLLTPQMTRWALQNLKPLNGAGIIGFVENLTGDEILSAIAAMDEPTVSNLADVASSIPLVQALLGEDLNQELGSLNGMNGQQLLDAFAAMDGKKMYEYLSKSGLGNLVKAFGVGPAAFESLTGQAIIDLVRQFNGQKFLAYISTVNGEMIVDGINDATNALLTDIRSKAAVSANVADPGEYKGFDLLITLRSVQSFLTDVTGVQIPDLTVLVTSFDGKRLIEGIRSMTIVEVMSAMNTLAPVMNAMLNLSGNEIVTSATGFLQVIVNYFATNDGAQVIEDLRNLNFKNFVTMLKKVQRSRALKKIIGFDLQPYIDALSKINGETIVTGIQNTKGSRILQMFSETGTLDYLRSVPGFDAAAFEAQVEQFDGAKLIQSVSQMTQPELSAEITKVGGQIVGAVAPLIAL